MVSTIQFFLSTPVVNTIAVGSWVASPRRRSNEASLAFFLTPFTEWEQIFEAKGGIQCAYDT